MDPHHLQVLRLIQAAVHGEIVSWQTFPNFRSSDPPRLTARCQVRFGSATSSFIVKANTNKTAISSEAEALKLLAKNKNLPFSVPKLLDFDILENGWSWLIIEDMHQHILSETQSGVEQTAQALVHIHTNNTLRDQWSKYSSKSKCLTNIREKKWQEALMNLSLAGPPVLGHLSDFAREVFNRPLSAPYCFVHGDFHCYNIYSEKPGHSSSSLVILDWEDAGIGHPWIDIAKYISLVEVQVGKAFLNSYHNYLKCLNQELSMDDLQRVWCGAAGEIALVKGENVLAALIPLVDQLLKN